jgi:hypothetical protein
VIWLVGLWLVRAVRLITQAITAILWLGAGILLIDVAMT